MIVVRNDLKMSKGKLAVQVAHAAVNASESARIRFIKWWRSWMCEGQKKIVVKVENQGKLLEVYDKALTLNLPVSLIVDRGLTELKPGTMTCIGIGPAPSKIVDKVTGNLPLL